MKVSVVLCTRNGERFIREQLDSIVAQTVPPGELIIRDDASTDRTVEILRSYEQALPLQITVNESTLGSTRNFELAIAEASGAVIALCDQDDAWDPKKLERLGTAFAPGVGLVFSDAELIDENGRRLGKRLWEAIDLRGPLLREFQSEPLNVLLRGKSVVTGAAMAFRTELRDVVLPIPSCWVHDGWIAIVTAFAQRLQTIQEPLIDYRIHSRQQLGIELPVSSYTRLPDELSRQIRMYETVLERVRAFADQRRLDCLSDALRHWVMRASLSEFRAARFLPIVRGLLAGEYNRYSNGWLSAAKDLLVK